MDRNLVWSVIFPTGILPGVFVYLLLLWEEVKILRWEAWEKKCVSGEHQIWICPFQTEVVSQDSAEPVAIKAVTAYNNLCLFPVEARCLVRN